MTNNLMLRRIQKFGSYSISDNKIRVKYSNGLESVLFEDISSVSYLEIKIPDFKISLLFTFIAFIFIIIGASLSNVSILFFSVLIIITGFVLMFANKKKWDNVIIETRGGKEIIYSVEHGKGEREMERIEQDRRNQPNKL